MDTPQVEDTSTPTYLEMTFECQICHRDHVLSQGVTRLGGDPKDPSDWICLDCAKKSSQEDTSSVVGSRAIVLRTIVATDGGPSLTKGTTVKIVNDLNGTSYYDVDPGDGSSWYVEPRDLQFLESVSEDVSSAMVGNYDGGGGMDLKSEYEIDPPSWVTRPDIWKAAVQKLTADFTKPTSYAAAVEAYLTEVGDA